MKHNFNSIEELALFLEIEKISISNLDINIIPIVEHKEEIINEIATCNVNLIGLCDNPTISGNVSNENILFVENFDEFSDLTCESCATGKIKYLNREILTNICNENNKTIIHMDLEVNGKAIYNVPFELKKKDNKFDTIIIDKKLL